MKFRLFILSILLSLNVVAQFGQPKFTSTTVTPPPPPPGGTVNLVVPAIADNTEYAPRYGGVSNWNTETGAKIVPNLNETCYYFRLTWLDCESSTVQGDYTKLNTDPTGPGGIGRMKARVTTALNEGKLFAFGIMQFYFLHSINKFNYFALLL